jgi:2-phospho-L-lactate guanylyltransferase
MMRTLAAIPLRGLADGKSRLRDLLPDRVRRALILALLERTARAVLDAGVIDLVLAVSPDPEILRWAQRFGLTPLPQTSAGLNAALSEATDWARKQQPPYDALLALHADLPLITAPDVRTLMEQLAPPPQDAGEVIVVGDRHNLGTTALLMRPVGAAPFHFGDQSFTRHLVAGEARGLRTVAHAAHALAFDLDTPADIAALVAWHPLIFAALCRDIGHWLPQMPQAAPPDPTATPHPAEENFL